MPATDVTYNQEELDALMSRARDLLASTDDSVAEISADTGLDPETVQSLQDDETAAATQREDAEDTISTVEDSNAQAQEASAQGAREIEKAGEGMDTHTTAAASDAAQQAAAEQASQQMAAQQQASQQAAQQRALQEQMSAQQQAQWQQAMQQQAAQAQMNQMNQQAQAQAVNQVASSGSTLSVDEIQTMLDEMFADDSTHVDTGDGSTGSYDISSSGGVSEGNLGGAENVSFDKTYPDGALSDDEMSAVIQAAADANGVPDDPELRATLENLYRGMSEHESGDNPNAANGWDSNAVGAEQVDGFPAQSSRGLVQCIPETFSTYHVSGTSNSIYDPVASVAASMNYLTDRYGVDLQTGAGLAEFGANRGIDVSSGDKTGGYIGY